MKNSITLLTILSPLAWAQVETLCSQYAYYSADGWYINNNEWGSSSGTGTQCSYLDSINTGGISWHTDWTWSGGDDDVKSYAHAGAVLSSQKLVSNIGTMPNSAAWSYEGDDIRANVNYDIFTAADPDHDTDSGDYELMIWLARLGGVDPIGSSVGTVIVDGLSWDLWVDTVGPMYTYSFVAPSPIYQFSSDIKPFFDYLTNHYAFPATKQYLITMQFGSEAFTGSDCRFIAGHWDGHVE